MLYPFLALIVLAASGIAFVVFKYFRPSFKKRNSKIGGVKGEDFWLNLIKDNPMNPYPYKKLGDWYMENKNKEYAVETFKHALKLDPKDGNLRKKLAELEE